MIRNGLVALISASLVVAGIGCRRDAGPTAKPEPPIIPVSHPTSREVADYVFYTGRVAAPESVDIRARVTGYIVKSPFKEGTEIKKGELLFEIDPRPYQAQLAAQQASVLQKEANYRLAKSENRRSRSIASKAEGFIAAEDLEKSSSQEVQGLGDYNLAQANLKLAELNVEFTKVISPIDGLVGRYNYTVGNLVTQDQSLLTSIVSVDPMYVYFDVDERTVVRVRKAINEGKIKQANGTQIPVNMELEGESGYPNHGHVDFVNNTVSMTTGTLTLRGVFANPTPSRGRRLLSPGMFVRIQLPIGQPHEALLVAERALGSDQGAKFVYLIDNDHKVQYRRVQVGAQQDDGLRAIESGLKADDWVVVGGLPQVRPRMEVVPEETAMPTLASMGGDATPAETPPKSGTAKGAGPPPSAPAKPAPPPQEGVKK